MSGEPKTLTLTLEETAVRVAEESDYLLARAQDGWGLIKRTVLGWDSEGLVWDDWEDAASFALGVRVVARDEAAELRAALREWREASRAEAEAHKAWTDAIAAQPPLTEYIQNWGKAKDRKDDAVAALRRLAGGENEK